MRRFFRGLTEILTILILFSSCAYALTPDQYDAAMPQNLEAEMLYAQSAVLMDAASGDLLFSKSANLRMHPASTTKIMTLLLGIESGIPLDREIAIPQAASKVPGDSTLIPVFPGETMTFGDLLVAFTVSSGNDGANAIAILVAGTIDNFVERMNARAQELGCKDTRFANAHGYTAEGHYTSAYDLALITQAAMKNPTFREIVKNTRVTVNVKERGKLTLQSKHYIMLSDSEFYYPDCIGVKTGSTEAAGKCYVGAAERNGVMLISVVLKCNEENERWIDTRRLFEYGWTCYDAYTLDKMYRAAAPGIGSFVISNAASDDAENGHMTLEIAQLSNSNYLRMVERKRPGALEDAIEDLKRNSTVEITHDLTAPITRGEIMGSFTYVDPDDGSVVTAKLIASRDVAEKTVLMAITDLFPFLKIFGNQTFLILLIVVGLIVVLLIIFAISRKAARQRRRKRILEQKRREYLRRQRQLQQRSRFDDEDDYDRVPTRRVNSDPKRRKR